jgi:hypothetical protein
MSGYLGYVLCGIYAYLSCSQDLPFGGTKSSGYGRFGQLSFLALGILTDCEYTGGPEGLRSLTNPKAVVVDRWPWLFQTRIPRPLDYPMRSPAQAWYVLKFCDSTTRSPEPIF